MNTYVPYTPIMFDNAGYRTIEINDEFNENLQIVLKYYDIDFRVGDDGGTLVKRKLIRNEELIHNYTKKALSQEWLKDRR
jgi:hypothetical protein